MSSQRIIVSWLRRHSNFVEEYLAWIFKTVLWQPYLGKNVRGWRKTKAANYVGMRQMKLMDSHLRLHQVHLTCKFCSLHFLAKESSQQQTKMFKIKIITNKF